MTILLNTAAIVTCLAMGCWLLVGYLYTRSDPRPAGTPHRATKRCATEHCYVHHVDEPAMPGEKFHKTCWQCGHLYWKARDLRAEYVRRACETAPTGFLRQLRAALTPARRISICPLCNGDF